MGKYKFYIADAFTEEIFGGNTAGIVVLEPGDDFPLKEKMIKLAAELKYSETVFILPGLEKDSWDFHARYFTPTDEVALCGHATIAGMYVLSKIEMINEGVYKLKTGAETIDIQVDGSRVIMGMATPENIDTIDDPRTISELYSIMGLTVPNPSSIGRLKPMLISTGLPDIMLPVSGKKELDIINPNMKRLSEFSERWNSVGVHAFTTEFAKENNSEIKAFCRNFAPLYGIDEEAATGTSNGALAYYLHLNGLLGSDGTLKVIQGEAMHRPSSIDVFLSADPISQDIVTVRVGGSAVILAEGKVYL